jgi:hypothetical protein
VADLYDDQETLDLFLEQTDKLARSPLLASGGLSTSLEVNFAPGGPSTLTVKRPDQTELGAFLLTFRTFVADRSPIEFHRVQRVYRANVRSDELIAQAEDAGRAWREACRSSPIAVQINEQTLRPDKVLDLWIDGEYFHLDRRKRDDLKALGPLGAVMTEEVLKSLLLAATKYVFDLQGLIVLARRQSLL